MSWHTRSGSAQVTLTVCAAFAVLAWDAVWAVLDYNSEAWFGQLIGHSTWSRLGVIALFAPLVVCPALGLLVGRRTRGVVAGTGAGAIVGGVHGALLAAPSALTAAVPYYSLPPADALRNLIEVAIVAGILGVMLGAVFGGLGAALGALGAAVGRTLAPPRETS